ncbi:MAG: signal peptidase I [Candidatus Saccharimonadales bacterium]
MTTTNKKPKPKISNIIGWIFLSICLLILAAAAFLAIDAKTNNRPISVFGHQFYFVVTGSMEPTIKTNGVAVAKQQDFANVAVGDIIAFRSEAMNGQVAIHRVIALSDDGATTQGDNNNNPDGGFVTSDNFQGIIVHKTNITADYLASLHQPGGILRMVVLPILILALVILAYKYITWGRDWRFRGLIISLIALLVSGSIFISFNFYVSRRQSVINEKLTAAAQDFADSPIESKTYVNGKEVLGNIEIESLKIKYPIIKFTSRSSLEVSIALYSDTELNQQGNVVLVGEHSYGNVFFTKINQLSAGDEITISAADGSTKTYAVESSRSTVSTDTSVFEKNKNQNQLTLVSTDYDMLNFFVVQAIEL